MKMLQPKPAGVLLVVSNPQNDQAAVCLVKDGASACRINQVVVRYPAENSPNTC